MMAVRSIITLTLIAVLAAGAVAQEVSPSVLNVFRYGTGKSGSGDLKDDFSYVEELMDLRVSFPRSLIVGVRLLYDIPPEVGPQFRGINRRYAEFSWEGVTIRAGNSAQLFGQGLALNLFEDRGLAYDTWLDGLKLGFSGSFLRAAAVAGRVEYWDSVVVARTETYDLRAANLEIDPLSWMMLGGSYVETDGVLPGVQAPVLLAARIHEAYASVRLGPIDAFAAWSHKRTTLPADTSSHSGSGLYAALSWTGRGAGIALDYKDYRYDIQDPFGRYDATRPTRMLPIQNPPTVQREHTWTYLTRALHQVDFNDEVGVQVEGFVKVAEATTLTVNASLSSEHDYYDYQAASFTFQPRERANDFLPSADPLLSPYWEALLEGEHYVGDRGLLRIALARREYIQAVLFSAGNDHVIRSTVLPGLVQVGIDELNTLTLQVELEWVGDNYNVSEEHYSNQLIIVSYSRIPGLSLAVRSEFTSNPSDPSGRRNWFAGDLGYRLGGHHTMVLTVGQERGGQICANGVCRFIQPFNGVRFALQTNF